MEAANLMRRTYRGGKNSVSSVGDLVNAGLHRLNFETKIREHTAPLVWNEVVGPQVAGATEIIKVDNGILIISTKSSVWAHELTFYKADILRRLNAKLGVLAHGEPVIKDLRFQNRGVVPKPTRSTKPPLAPSPDELDDVAVADTELATIEEGIASIGDEGLRNRLRRLRIADVKLRTWRLDNGWIPCPDCGEIAPPRLLPDGEWVPGEADCSRCRIARHSVNQTRR